MKNDSDPAQKDRQVRESQAGAIPPARTAIKRETPPFFRNQRSFLPEPERKSAPLHMRQGFRTLPETPDVLLVGAVGFEPTAPCSQSRCATRLRHAPLNRSNRRPVQACLILRNFASLPLGCKRLKFPGREFSLWPILAEYSAEADKPRRPPSPSVKETPFPCIPAAFLQPARTTQ